MTDDIVTRLRETEGGYTLRGILREAADEIERLRNGGCARDQRTTQFCAEAERLRAERDEARRMVCALDADILEDQIEYAQRRGWHCFREHSP
jgi:hypothetical protein